MVERGMVGGKEWEMVDGEEGGMKVMAGCGRRGVVDCLFEIKKDTGIKSLMNMKSLWPQVVCGGADTYHTTYQHRKSSSEAPLCVCVHLFSTSTQVAKRCTHIHTHTHTHK